MRIYELFEDLPGIMSIPITPVATNTSNVAATKPVGTNMTPNTTPVAPTPVGGSPAAIPPPIQQQFSKGQNITVPEGPNKAITNLKIGAVDPQNKTVTLNNPKNPNAPGLTYKQSDISNILGAKK